MLSQNEINEIQVLILTAGKIPSELECLFSTIPSGLIPINGKPALFLILDKLLKEGFSNVLVGIGFQKERVKDLLKKFYSSRLNLDFVESNFFDPPGNTILRALKKISAKKLLVILADTLIDDDITSLVQNGSFVLSSRDFLESRKWCLVGRSRKGGYLDKVYHKIEPENYDNLEALVGVYYFDKVNVLRKIVVDFKNKKVEIANILKPYNKERKIKVITTKNWYDVGHLNKYYETKRKFLQSRFFNQFKIDPILNTITKKSERGETQQKFINEIKWYQNLPNDLKSFCPAIIEMDTNTPYLKMEYIGYPTLSELWLYGNLSLEIWEDILNRLFEIVDVFRKNLRKVQKTDYNEMYIKKTEKRIRKLIKINPTFREILRYPEITINGKRYKNFPQIAERICRRCQDLYNRKDNCIIHGDLCFSNIFYSVDSGVFKFIDPRGNWGKQSMAGDIKYDLAKLRHSIVGTYDFIINKLYSLEQIENKIDMDIFSGKIHEDIGNYFDNEIKKNWNLEQIKLIEGLLFISMLPLHNDDLERQLAFFAVGIKRLNEVLK